MTRSHVGVFCGVLAIVIFAYAGAAHAKPQDPQVVSTEAPVSCSEAIQKALGKVSDGQAISMGTSTQSGTIDACYGGMLVEGKDPSSNPADYECVGRQGSAFVEFNRVTVQSYPLRGSTKGTCLLRVCDGSPADVALYPSKCQAQKLYNGVVPTMLKGSGTSPPPYTLLQQPPNVPRPTVDLLNSDSILEAYLAQQSSPQNTPWPQTSESSDDITQKLKEYLSQPTSQSSTGITPMSIIDHQVELQGKSITPQNQLTPDNPDVMVVQQTYQQTFGQGNTALPTEPPACASWWCGVTQTVQGATQSVGNTVVNGYNAVVDTTKSAVSGTANYFFGNATPPPIDSVGAIHAQDQTDAAIENQQIAQSTGCTGFLCSLSPPSLTNTPPPTYPDANIEQLDSKTGAPLAPYTPESTDLQTLFGVKQDNTPQSSNTVTPPESILDKRVQDQQVQIQQIFDQKLQDAQAQVQFAQELVARNRDSASQAVLNTSNYRLQKVQENIAAYEAGTPSPELKVAIDQFRQGQSQGILSQAFTDFADKEDAGANEILKSLDLNDTSASGMAKNVYNLVPVGMAKVVSGVTNSANNLLGKVGVPGFAADSTKVLGDVIDPAGKTQETIGDILVVAPFAVGPAKAGLGKIVDAAIGKTATIPPGIALKAGVDAAPSALERPTLDFSYNPISKSWELPASREYAPIADAGASVVKPAVLIERPVITPAQGVQLETPAFSVPKVPVVRNNVIPFPEELSVAPRPLNISKPANDNLLPPLANAVGQDSFSSPPFQIRDSAIPPYAQTSPPLNPLESPRPISQLPNNSDAVPPSRPTVPTTEPPLTVPIVSGDIGAKAGIKVPESTVVDSSAWTGLTKAPGEMYGDAKAAISGWWNSLSGTKPVEKAAFPLVENTPKTIVVPEPTPGPIDPLLQVSPKITTYTPPEQPLQTSKTFNLQAATQESAQQQLLWTEAYRRTGAMSDEAVPLPTVELQPAHVVINPYGTVGPEVARTRTSVPSVGSRISADAAAQPVESLINSGRIVSEQSNVAGRQSSSLLKRGVIGTGVLGGAGGFAYMSNWYIDATKGIGPVSQPLANQPIPQQPPEVPIIQPPNNDSGNNAPITQPQQPKEEPYVPPRVEVKPFVIGTPGIIGTPDITNQQQAALKAACVAGNQSACMQAYGPGATSPGLVNPSAPASNSFLGNLFRALSGLFAGSSLSTPPTPSGGTQSPTATPPPVITLIANPQKVAPEHITHLAWSSVGMRECGIFDGSGAPIASGTEGAFMTSPLIVTTVFLARCTAFSGAPTVASTTVLVQ